MEAKYLVSASRDKTVRVWDLKSLECKRVLRAEFGRFIPLVADEQYVYAYSPKEGIILWAWKTGEIKSKIQCDLGDRECALAIDKDHLYAGVCLADKQNPGIWIWSKKDWSLEHFLPMDERDRECSRILIDGGHLHVLSLLDMIEWDLSDHRQIRRWTPIDGDVYTFSLDPRYLYVGPFVFSRQNNQRVATLLENTIREIHFVENDERYVYMTYSESDQPFATIWQKGNWKLHRSLALPGQKHSFEALAISDNYIFLGGEKYISIWSKATWQCEHVLTGHSDFIWNLIVF